MGRRKINKNHTFYVAYLYYKVLNKPGFASVNRNDWLTTSFTPKFDFSGPSCWSCPQTACVVIIDYGKLRLQLQRYLLNSDLATERKHLKIKIKQQSFTVWQHNRMERFSFYCVVWMGGLPFNTPSLKASTLINKVIYSNFAYQNSAI